MMQVRKLRVNGQVSPNSLTPGSLTISWLPCEKQSAYALRILEKENCVYDSGKRLGRDTHFSPDFSTGSARNYRLELILYDERNQTGETFLVSFGTVIGRADWRAGWIDPEPDRKENVREKIGIRTYLKKLLFHKDREDVRYNASYLRKRFVITPEQAKGENRLYMTAHGMYALWVNGEPVKDWVLAPGCTQYPAILNVQAYDISDRLCSGENEIIVCLCDGWYRGSMNNERNLDTFGTDIALLAELRCDGTTVFATDDSWETTKDGPVGLNDLQLGEHCDANRSLDKAAWGSVALRDCPMDNLTGSDCPRICEHERFSAKLLITPNEEKILDFGQNFAGYVEMHIPASGGEHLTLTHGETLDSDGNFTQKNIIEVTKPSAYQQVFYTCKAGMNDYCPVSCFFGFRYVRVEADMDIQPEWFTGVAVYSDMEKTASFTCGNPLVNRLFQNSLWSMKSNFIGVMMDCPTRERSGYTGDAQVFCPTGLYLMDCYGVYSSWLRSLEQLFTPDGQLKMFAPDNKPVGFMDSGHGWCDAVAIIPYLMWKRTGDSEILRMHYEAAKRWVDFALSRAAKKTSRKGKQKLPPDLQPYFADQGFGFGEWLEVKNSTTVAAAVDGLKHILFGEPEVGTAYLSYSCRIVSEMAEALGKGEDAIKYAKAAEFACKAYRCFYTDNGIVHETKRQCLYVRPMALGLLNETENVYAAERLAKLIHQNSNHLNTGFLSTAYICRMLSDYGQTETACSLLLQEDSPSWLYEVKKGATTIWESWLGIDKKGEIHSSFNHYSLGAVTGWLLDSVCGIRVECGQISIAPKPDKRLGFAEGSYDSPVGTISSCWEYTQNSILFTITIPTGVNAMVTLPDGKRMICSEGVTKIERKF